MTTLTQSILLPELPDEIIDEILKFANIKCCVCKKKINLSDIKDKPVSKNGHQFLCSQECFRNTCIFQRKNE